MVGSLEMVVLETRAIVLSMIKKEASYMPYKGPSPCSGISESNPQSAPTESPVHRTPHSGPQMKHPDLEIPRSRSSNINPHSLLHVNSIVRGRYPRPVQRRISAGPRVQSAPTTLPAHGGYVTKTRMRGTATRSSILPVCK